ncbi:putative transcriptional regulatory protein [Oligella urethralis]|uniref:YebC/PmpR family DNA-binding transcriptional regulator n=1 Tax=Oligella urethralis TaxID=90245 RepID=UPI000362E05E|nr:YebC/PmpR family DNA-binding transcriptional regulator [Oligella urethralis]PMC16825.1 YebC/PmpR family DNA-binding transcriptional regulator [Oligella urethralis]WOS37174.1 putative transcriptional regulatory protein [Oligella urethralis]SUA68180.1 Transcriptional regulatory protein PmpR [Oligella urethralis]
MAGHSKWANIQHRKGRQDAKRGKIWTKIIREITVAARAGGPDPESNPALRLAMDKANASNMPKDNINRAIQRGAGAVDGEDYEFVRYEGYGVAGAAVIVDCMTDNRQRTVSEVRHALTKNGGNLGTDGSVTFMFDHVSQFLFGPDVDEEQIMEVGLEAGANDIDTDEDGLTEVLGAPSDFAQLRDAFEAAGLQPEVAEIIMRPQNEIELNDADGAVMQKIIDTLEDLDDVQKVYTNAVFDEE